MAKKRLLILQMGRSDFHQWGSCCWDPVAGAGRMARDWTGQSIHQRAAAAFNDRSSLASLGDRRPIGGNGKAATIA